MNAFRGKYFPNEHWKIHDNQFFENNHEKLCSSLRGFVIVEQNGQLELQFETQADQIKHFLN